MNIFVLEPYFGGSHKQWAEGLAHHSQHSITLFTLPDKVWKWRMHGAAITMGEEVNRSSITPDLILASSMIDLATFLAYTKVKTARVPVVYYFHENQITYPKSSNDTDAAQNRDNHYGFIQITNALVADQVWFNSPFHKRIFMRAMPTFLKQFPKPNLLEQIKRIPKKSYVVPVGLSLPEVLPIVKPNPNKIILWNHRWEEDKNPIEFFKALRRLKQSGRTFELIICGKAKGNAKWVFEEAKEEFREEIIHFGFVKSKFTYWELLKKADILLVTSNQEFFGISFLEALHAGCFPLVPNRLVYPDYFKGLPDGENCVYRSKKHRDELLKNAIDKPKLPSFSQIASPFVWENAVKEYDLRFCNFPNNN